MRRITRARRKVAIRQRFRPFVADSGHLGPIVLFTVSGGTTPGNYEFSGRLLDPVTGQQYSQSLRAFIVQ